MSEPGRIESRGVRCLDCSGLDLQKCPETAKNGFGWCTLHEFPHFVSVSMSRNCFDYVPAPSGEADKRAALVDAKKVLFWRR